MMAAVRAAQLGAGVTLVEKNPVLGKKLLLTGKGRCNLTNACGLDEFLPRFGKNGAFLRDAFKNFFNKELMEFFETRGLKLKIERQQRVFPDSDRSSTVLAVLKTELEKLGVRIMFRKEVRQVLTEDARVTGVELSGGEKLNAEAVVLATGGLSYAFTGSTGSGIKNAADLGHKIVACRPGLVALVTEEKFVRDLMGLTLKNIRLVFTVPSKSYGREAVDEKSPRRRRGELKLPSTQFSEATAVRPWSFTDGKRKIITDIGELLFTDFGISGPLVLTHSSTVVDWLAAGNKVSLAIDLKPALTKEELNARLVKEFQAQPRRNMKNLLKEFLPSGLIEVFLQQARVAGEKTANQIRQTEREAMAGLFKGFGLTVVKTLPIEEAMVTKGGVSLKDINPRTMESKRIAGLFFAGEIIDIDGDTGGFNLQAAFSTGYLAGEKAAG